MSSNNSLKGPNGQEKDVASPIVLIDDIAEKGHAAPFDATGHGITQFDAAAESRLRNKIDRRIVPIVFLVYLWCFIDRANIGNARLAGLERDLKMSGFDYNIALTVFYVFYTVFEIPVNVLTKIVRPGRAIPVYTFLFGLVSLATAFVHTYGALLAVRALLGVFECGLLPGIAFYLSRWYRKNELAFRLAGFFVAAPLAGAFGGLLASGILKIKPFGMINSWRTIFFIEGLVTMAVGVAAYVVMTDNPQSARWLNESEKALAEARIKSENVGATTSIEKLNKSAVYSGIFNIHTMILGFMFLWVNITVQGVAVFTPTIVAALYPTESVIQKQLKTVPPYIVGSAINLLVPFISWKIGRRGLPMLATAPILIVGFAMFIGASNPNVKYAAAFLTTSGAFPFGAMCTAVTSINSAPDSARASAIGTVVMLGNVGGIISAWTYLPRDAPRYIRGNSVNLAGGIIIFLTTGLMMFYQRWENKQRDKGRRDDRLENTTFEEQAVLGHRHPAFRYVY